MATKENKFFATFLVPEKQRDWVQYARRKPRKTLELEEADIAILGKVQYPKGLKQRLQKILQKTSPCEANCGNCPAYKGFLCCQATVFHKRSSSEE